MLSRTYRFLAVTLCLALLLNSVIGALPRLAVAATLPATLFPSLSQPVALTADCHQVSGNVFLPLISTSAPRPQAGSAPTDLGFGPIPAQRALLGSTFMLPLPVNNPTNATLTFAVEPLPLPAHATFDPAVGLFTFAPALDQISDYSFTFHVTDGVQRASVTVLVTVPAPDPTVATALCGRILDANAANGSAIKPLVGATVRLMESTLAATTDSNGYFLMTGLPAGEHYFEYDGNTATPVGTYGAYRGQKVIIANVINIVDRPLYIMGIDKAGETDINPNGQTIVNNPNLNVTVTIPPNTVLDDNGQLYAGKISVSPVPEQFTPAALPSNLDPSRVLTIQPMGLTFRNPAPISFPNTDNLTPGSEVDIWSLDHELGQFFIAGKGQVTADGKMVETIEGGIRESSWHFPMPPGFGPGGPGDGPCSTCKPPPCPIGSRINLATGCLETSLQLPPYRSLEESRQLQFSYLSDRAYPAPILPFEATLAQQAAIPDAMHYQLRSFGGVTSGLAAPIVWNTAGLDENRAEPLRGAVSINGANLNTGVYPYAIRLTNQYGAAAVSTDVNGQYLLVNERNSPFGAGWALAGLQRLTIQANGDLLNADGDGSTVLFRASSSVFPIDANVLALLEFDGNVNDLSGNNRHATLLGGNFVTTALGQGLRVDPSESAGIDWSAYANLLQHPYTIEFILTPTDTRNWRKLFSFDDLADGGWYYKNEGIQAYPHAVIGTGDLKANDLHYLTFVSTAPDQVNVYFQGNLLGSTDASFTAPPVEAIFFRDEQNTGRGEQLIGTIDALRISQSTRTTTEIANVQNGITNRTFATKLDTFITPAGEFSTITKDVTGSYTRRMKDGIQYRFNAAGLQTTLIDRNGNTTHYAYDGSNHLTSITDPVGLVTMFAYNGAHLQTVTDPMGRTTTFAHNDAGDLVRVTFPDGSNQQFGYDDRHLMTSETDERGFVTTRVYDGYGRLVSAVVPSNITRSTSYAQKVGLVTDPTQGTSANPAPIVRPEAVRTTVTDGENRTTTYTFGSIQSITAILEPTGLTTTIARDQEGNPTQYSYPSGQVINQSFDGRGNLRSINDPTVQGTTGMVYEPLFNQLVTITDPFANVTAFTYDSKGNQTRIVSPLNRTLRTAYNGFGLPTVMTDTLGTVATLGYDGQGNQTTLRWGSSADIRTAAFGYTPHGYLQSITDPLGRNFGFGYDNLGRLTSESLPGNRSVSYGYDAGDLTSLTPPGRPAHQFEYDGLGQMTAYIPPLVLGVSNPRTRYEYDKAQQVTKTIRPDGLVVSYGYDNGGRLQATQFSRGVVTYNYDTVTGQLSTINAPDTINLNFQYAGDLLTTESWSGILSGSVQRTYDAGYRIDSISVNNDAITYQYDADNAPIQAGALTLSYQPTSGLLADTTLGNVNDSYGYNAFAELQSYRANGGATPLFQTSYARDSLGRITTLTETITNTTNIYLYAYDTADRLERVTRNGTQIALYSYDANGNRLSITDLNGTTTGSYDDQDRLLSYGSALYSYNANGDLQSKLISGQKTEYSYDEFGNLTRVTLPGNDTITYLIDGKDRRVGKKVNGVLTKGWLYEDQLRLVAELDGSGTVVSRFVYATQVNVPDYMVKDGVTYRLVLDHLGSVRLVVNTQTGQVVQRMDYDTWGMVTLDTNPGFQPFGFAGGLWDGQAWLVRFGARDYDPVAGRWTTKDPMGLESYDSNLYRYVFDDPINFIDGNGESAITAGRLGGSIGFGLGGPVGALIGVGAGLLVGHLLHQAIHAMTEHTKGQRPSTEEKHEKGQGRKKKDRGGEKGDKDGKRRPPNKRPPGYKGPWPPKQPCG